MSKTSSASIATRNTRRRAFLLLGLCAAFGPILAGCPDRDEVKPPDPTTTPRNRMRLTVNWAARSRQLSAPASALSAVVRIKQAQVGGGDFVMTVNRDGNAAAHSQVYETQDVIYTGDRLFEIAFHTDPNGVGAVVASASDTVKILDNGLVQETITNIRSNIATVEVAPNQKVNVGEQKFLSFSARNNDGALIGITPGSAFFNVVSGGDLLRANGEVGEGLSGGTAQVTATIDGKTSAPMMVTVNPALRVALVGNTADPEIGNTERNLRDRKLTVTTYVTMPALDALQNADVLVVQGGSREDGRVKFSASVTPADAPKVRDFLNSGRGVVLLEDAPRALAGTEDLQSIRSWFGDVRGQEMGYTFTEIYATQAVPPFALPPSVSSGQRFDLDEEKAYLYEISDQFVKPILGYGDARFATAYENASGNRIYYQFHPVGLNPSNAMLDLLIAGMNWTAKR